MSNFQAGGNLSGNNKMVDDKHNGGSKNVIGRKTNIKGDPIVGDKSGNNIKKGNNTTVNINNNVNVEKLCLELGKYCFVAVVVIIIWLMYLSYCFVAVVVAVVVIILVRYMVDDGRQSHHRPQQRQQNHHREDQRHREHREDQKPSSLSRPQQRQQNHHREEQRHREHREDQKPSSLSRPQQRQQNHHHREDQRHREDQKPLRLSRVQVTRIFGNRTAIGAVKSRLQVCRNIQEIYNRLKDCYREHRERGRWEIYNRLKDCYREHRE